MFFFQAEDGIRDLVRSRGLGDVYKRQEWHARWRGSFDATGYFAEIERRKAEFAPRGLTLYLSLIHI